MSGRWQIFWIGILALCAFLGSLGFEAIAASHEARVAQTAREMAAAGWPWNAQLVAVAPASLRPGPIVRLTPDPLAPPIHLNPWMIPLLKGTIRLQKPPLPYWCDAVLFRFFGFSEWTARLVPALLGALGTALIYGLAWDIMGRRRALYAAIAWVSMAFIPQMYRLTMADPYLSFFTLLCVWAWVSPRWTPNHGQKSWARILIFYVSIGLGLLSKGPVLFVHLVIALGAYHVCFKRRAPGTLKQHIAGMILALAISLPWPCYVLLHISNAVQVWRYESVGEMSDNVENARVWWFYLPNLPLLLSPWMVVAAIACIRNIGSPITRRWPKRQRLDSGFPVVGTGQAPDSVAAPAPIFGTVSQQFAAPSWRQARLFPILWLFITVVFFSFVNLKKNPYLLPMMPAAAMLVGQGLQIVLAAARRTRFIGWPGTVVGFQALLGAVGAIAITVIGYHYSLERRLLLIAGLFTLVVALCGVVASHRHASIQRWVCWQGGVYVLLGLMFSRFIISPQDNARSARVLGRELSERARDRNYAVMVPRLPEEVAIYLPLWALRPQPALPHQLVVTENHHDPATLDRWFPGRSVLMTTEVPLTSTQGDSRWKVYDVWIEPRNYAMK